MPVTDNTGVPPLVHRYELSSEDFDAFEAALNNPPAPTEALRRLMAKAAPWEQPDRRDAKSKA